MIENAALSKLPVIKPLSANLEKFLELAINSRARDKCAMHAARIRANLKNVAGPSREFQLWCWWHEDLRKIPGERRAQRLYERGSKMTRPWDITLDDDVREEGLIALLAYTRVVNGESYVADQAPPLTPSHG